VTVIHGWLWLRLYLSHALVSHALELLASS